MSVEIKKPRWYETHVLKILSLFISFFLWFYVVNSEPIELKRKFFITVTPPVGYAVEQITPRRIPVTIKGARAFIKRFKGKEPKLTLNLAKSKVGSNKEIRYELSKRDFNLPFGVDILDLNDDVVKVEFDKHIKKLIPVRVETSGELPSDLKLVTARVEPREVMIEGPRSLMKQIGQTKIKPIDITSFSGKGSTPVFLAPLPPYIKYMNKAQFSLDYEIRPVKANINLKNIKIKFISSTQRFKPSTRAVSLDVLAPEGRSLRASEVNVFATVPSGKKGNVAVRLRAELPDGVYLLKINPETINVRIY